MQSTAVWALHLQFSVMHTKNCIQYRQSGSVFIMLFCSFVCLCCRLQVHAISRKVTVQLLKTCLSNVLVHIETCQTLSICINQRCDIVTLQTCCISTGLPCLVHFQSVVILNCKLCDRFFSLSIRTAEFYRVVQKSGLSM